MKKKTEKREGGEEIPLSLERKEKRRERGENRPCAPLANKEKGANKKKKKGGGGRVELSGGEGEKEKNLRGYYKRHRRGKSWSEKRGKGTP